jgi:hypothetical protein
LQKLPFLQVPGMQKRQARLFATTSSVSVSPFSFFSTALFPSFLLFFRAPALFLSEYRAADEVAQRAPPRLQGGRERPDYDNYYTVRTPILTNTMLRIDLTFLFVSFWFDFYYWRVTTPTRSAAARMTPSTMRASPTAPGPHPARRPTPDMYLRTSARIISCIAATSSPLNG